MNLQAIIKYKKVRLKYDKSFIQSIVILSIIISMLKNVSANRPPRFNTDGQSEIVIRLKESPETPVGQLIYQLNGHDPDGDSLIFGVRHSQYSDIIKIQNTGENQANIYLAKELDRETKDEYALVLTLTDSQFGDESYVTQSLLLYVEDINDNVPIFRPYSNVIEIPENSSPGIITAYEAYDLDDGAYGQVIYYIQEIDGENDVFAISTYQSKGILRLVGALDYEKRNLYQLRVLAVDRASQEPIHTGTAEILVKVRDIEDQPPEFVQVQAVTRISEDAKPGTEVLKLRAIDGDHGINNKIKYSIERNNLFSIDENTGVIYTKNKLDRENNHALNGAYIVKVTAVEVTKINPPLYVRTEITIIISDVNDEIPTFREKLYRCEINENAQINTPIHFLDDVQNTVYDYDAGKNGTFKLFIEPENEIFEISPQLAVNEANFLIRVKNSTYLDYEKITEIKFKIIAKEIATAGKWSAADVHIYVRDQNDNFPKFLDAPYEVDVLENCEVGTSIARVQALDRDSGDYGTTGIRYIHLRGGIANLLHLDPITGLINLKYPGDAAFDREVNSRHYLTIEARDNVGFGNQNTAQIIINIQDVNDNPPIFLQRKYEATLIENKEEFETPLIIEARDMDLNGTENSYITYEIIDGLWKNNFTIDIKYGNIQPVGFIDFEELSNEISNLNSINLTVMARDSGMPSLYSKVNVIIYIQDVNDNAPIFEKKYYAKQIPEDLPGGTSVLEVKAYDFDGSKPNNDIVYRIKSGASDKFVIGSDNGLISVANGASLDPDFTSPKKNVYILKVIALDGGLGSSQLTAITTVNITIKDVNNKPPILMNLPTLKIPENTAVGTIVYQIMAADLDDSPLLRYRIDKTKSIAKREDGVSIKSSDYDYASAFDLNTVTGYLKIKKLIDREKVENIKLEIVAEDLASANGPQRAEATLNIQVEDENDNNPKFKEPFYKKSITENTLNGVTILNVAAFDIDKNKTVTYSIEGTTNATNLIHLDSETGEIVVANKIDHEINQWLNFSVRATDSGFPPRSSFVDVFISVLDENDNNPYFVTTAQNFSVKENSPITTTRVAKILARDDDSGDYGKITYLMDRISSQGRFSIDADTGVITVADKIDRESKDLYILVIEAWDNYQFGYSAGESRNAFKQIYINVIDENDSPPEVTLPIGCIQITEYHDSNEAITTIRGKDADDPSLPNGKLEMAIVKGNKDGLFKLEQLDAWTAQIFAKKSLKNKYGNHSLTISVKDLGKPANVIKRTLDICVADFNDHPPVFVSPAHNITIRVPENATVGSLVIQVYAIDDDVGPNALVKYKLKQDPLGNYKAFEIDSDTGMIFLKEKLNRSIQKIYEIRVEAYDQGVPTSLSSDLDLAIYVRNVNDYEPQFLVEEISVNFTEHTQPEIEKVKLPDTIDREEVDDLDDPPSAVCYFIVHGNEDNLFKLDQDTHILTIERELDREIRPNHTLYIRATENCASDSTITTKFNLQNLTFHQIVDNFDNVQSHQSRLVSSKRASKATTFESYFDRYKLSRKIRSSTGEIHEDINVDDLLADGTVVRVFVKVLDINDNPPKFKSLVFTGGVTTNADFGLKFMKVEAIDPDEGLNAKVKYYLAGEIRRTLSEGLENVRNFPFVIDENTGEILLNFDPQKDMKGHFDFMVIANDTDGQKDSAHVFIYLLREDQKVRIVFRQQPPKLRDKIDLFRSTLSNVTNAIVNINEFKVHENHDGSVDKTKTDLYLHLVNKKDNSIYEVSDVLNLIDKHIEELDGLFKDFNVLDTQPSEQQLSFSQIGTDSIFVWLIFSNIFVASILIVCLVLCASQRSNFKRQLRAAKVNIYNQTPSEISSPDPSTRVPNTNKHSVEGSNPIWLKGSENEWYKNFDDHKRNRKNSYSTDDNFSTIFKQSRLFDQPNDLNRHLNIYQQIDKLTNGAQMLAKKLETTEL